MNEQTLPSIVIKCNYSYDDDIDHMKEMINEMLEIYPNDKGYVLNSIGITEDEINGGYFDYEQFRNAFNFYSKEKARV